MGPQNGPWPPALALKPSSPPPQRGGSAAAPPPEWPRRWWAAAGLVARAGWRPHWKAWWKRGRVVVLRLELNTGGRGCRGPRASDPPPPEPCCS